MFVNTYKFSWMYRYLNVRRVASLETFGSDYSTDAACLRRTESSSMPLQKPQNSHNNSILIFISLFQCKYFLPVETYFVYHGATDLVGQSFLITEDSRSHSDTQHSAGFLWTSDQPVAETSTWQLTTPTRNRHPCSRRDSNPQSQERNGRWPTPWTARPLGSAWKPIRPTKWKVRLIIEGLLKSRKYICLFPAGRDFDSRLCHWNYSVT